MFTNILKFEWQFFFKKISFYIMILFYVAIGFMTATAANFTFPDTAINSPYVIYFVYGIISLLCIFSTTILAAQCLFREKDAGFDAILFATPLRKTPYVAARFFIIFFITLLCNLLFMCGFMLGHTMRGSNAELIPFDSWNYLQPFLIIMVPNILFCTAIATCIGLVSKNKLLVYTSGIIIYFLYWAISIFTQSPLMAASSPISPDSMNIAAKVDPFGVAAFFDQTKYWTATQRNSQLLQLSGNLLFNRILYTIVSGIFLLISFTRFSFSVNDKKKLKQKPESQNSQTRYLFSLVNTAPAGLKYDLQSWYSLVKIELKNIFKSIPLWIICIGWMGFLGMELFSLVHGNPRIPERFATTSLMVSCILKELPLIIIFITLFYGNEIFWRSKSTRFSSLEDATSLKPAVSLISKWISLVSIIFLLIAISILLGGFFQFVYNFLTIDWELYLSLFYLIGFPLLLTAAFIISINAIVKNKYTALIISALFLIFTNTSLSGALGIKTPLLLFANSFSGNYSDFNGFGISLKAFNIKMIYWFCITSILFLLAIKAWKYKTQKNPFSFLSSFKKPVFLAGVLLLTAGAFFSGKIIHTNTKIISDKEMNDHYQLAEEKYSYLKNLPQPTVTSIQTAIELYPEKSSYNVSGKYTMLNKTESIIDTITLFADPKMNWQSLKMQNGSLIKKDSVFGYYSFLLSKPLKPGDSVSMEFDFNYSASPFNKLISYNTIISNGTFIRISNFFPRPGYNNSEEIEDARERARRKMPLNDLLEPGQTDKNYDYGFIHLNTVISTSSDQTAIAVGELQKKWQQNNRNYFQYTSEKLIPFRFAVSSARYTIKTIQYKNTNIEVYYHPQHDQNIDHILSVAEKTMDFCEKNIDSFPFKTLRFVEISSFTRGFAGTAYPTDLFINESFGFQNKVSKDVNKDILNEMVSHELSHTWWGNSQISPEYKKGSILMTETLAMYTELMIYKETYGGDGVVNRVNVHKNLYLGDRGFAEEEPLYRGDPRKPYLFYDKGMTVMYQLYKYLGEEKINKALKSFYDKYSFPNPPPVSTDLINELYAVSDTSLHAKIDELLKQIVVYDLKIDALNLNKDKNGKYNLNIKASALKYKEDGNGNKTQIPFSESLEASIVFTDGTTQIINLNPILNKIDTTLLFSIKPAKVILDPEGKFLNISDENKEKNVPAF